MRLLLDENLPQFLAAILGEAAGWDVVHAMGCSLRSAPDHEVLAFARAHDRVLVSADTDFGGLLVSGAATAPSVVLLRVTTGRRAEHLAGLLVANLEPLREDLQLGSLVVIGDQRVRIRRLPIG